MPRAYLRLADLVLEHNSEGSTSQAKEYLRRFLENVAHHERKPVWLRLADLCHSSEDIVGEIHALSQVALLPTVTPEDIALLANRLNIRIRDLKSRGIEAARSAEVGSFLKQVIGAMERRIGKLSATDFSRLAWLHLNVGNEDRARDVAKMGIKRDPNNEYCRSLMRRLGI